MAELKLTIKPKPGESMPTAEDYDDDEGKNYNNTCLLS